MESLLVDYQDIEVVECLRFGFLISHDIYAPPPIPNDKNHKGALDYPQVIDKYINTELRERATFGPFLLPPFITNIGISPLSTHEKRSSTDRRVIMDLSFPEYGSVNLHIDKDHYLGQPIKLVFPTIDDLAMRVAELGLYCLLYKRDMSRYFCQVPACPGSYSFLGWRWDNLLYFDRMMLMGLVSSCYVSQRVTNSIAYIHRNTGYYCLNYLDDFGSAEPAHLANSSYESLGRLFNHLGVRESEAKAVPPTTRLEFLGTILDTVKMSMEVSPERVHELLTLVDEWLGKSSYNRNQLEKLIGKLQFVTNCVRSGRVFLTKFINHLAGMGEQRIELDEDMVLDLLWWKKFLPKYNGVSLIWLEKMETNALFATDATLTAIAGVCEGNYFIHKPPAQLMHEITCIAQMEMLAVMIASHLWRERFTGKYLCILCDNQSVMNCLNSGKAHDPMLQRCLRSIAMDGALYDFVIRSEYIRSKQNVIPDLLSRYHQDSTARRQFSKINRKNKLKRQYVKDTLYSDVLC